MKKLLNKKRIEFLESLEELRGYSDLTIKTYDEVLKESFIEMEIIEEEKDIVFNLMPYRIKISSLNPKTISKKLSVIRSFVEYLNDNGIKTILKADDTIKVSKTLPKPILHRYIVEALEKASLEERLIVLILYTCGVRISELSNLKLSNISDNWIRVLGKGNKQRDIPIIKFISELIYIYIDSCLPKEFLFEKDGRKKDENSLRYIVTKVFKRISLKVTPHQLRHSYATELLNGGAPIIDVSELLGHKSMATTQIYTKLGSVLKQKNYNKAHPLCGVDSVK